MEDQPPREPLLGPIARARRRDPRSVGEQPDYRFSLANERTFLAWIRTSLALTAAGLGVIGLLDHIRGAAVIGLWLILLSVVVAATSFRRWANAERAIRQGDPLPASSLPLIVAVATAIAGLGGVVTVLVAW